MASQGRKVVVDRKICRGRRVASLVLVLVLTGCTRAGEPTATSGTSDGEGAPVVGSTGANPSGATVDPVLADVEREPGLYRVDPATGDAELLLSAAREPREPERSPEGSALAYQSTGRGGIPQIFVLEDGETRQLTHLPGGAAEPTWSPDGSLIAFAGAMNVDDDTDIFVMETDGHDIRLLARTNRYDRRPDWSPDGSRIVFDTYGEIWMASVADGQVAQVPVVTPQGWPAAPIWSPNGRWIALTSYDAHTINGIVHITRLWVVRPDGSDRRPLEDRKPDFYDWQLEPSWSPDGRSIAFVGGNGRYGFRSSFDLGIIDVRSGEVVYISAPQRMWDLSWNAEGFIIASVTEGDSPSPPIWGVATPPTQDPWPGVG
jgi:Tol biopolymer transport system component